VLWTKCSTKNLYGTDHKAKGASQSHGASLPTPNRFPGTPRPREALGTKEGTVAVGLP
jgi:hypothetical protein